MAKGFYCTVKRGEKTAWLLGPFAEHETALELAFQASCKASDIDPRIAFDPYGTSAITREGAEIAELPKGKLNHLFPNFFA
jgi:hypothetical protein